MHTNLSNVRLPKHFPLQTLTPLQMRTITRFGKRGSSNNSVDGISYSKNSKSRSKVQATHSHSSGRSAIKQWNKGKSIPPPRRNFNIVGDAIVAKLGTDPINDLDQNTNELELEPPFNDQIAKDIAYAVAMIVAEHEMIRHKLTEQELKNSKKTKKTKGPSKDKAAGPETSQKIEDGTDTNKVVKAPMVEVPGQYDKVRGKLTLGKKIVEPSASTVINNNLPLDSLPPTEEQKPESQPEMPKEDAKAKPLLGKNKSSVTFSVPSRTLLATIPSRPTTGTEADILPIKKRSTPTVAHSSTNTATTVMPRSTPSAASSLSTIGSSHHVPSSYPPLPTIGAKMGGQLEVLKYLGRIQNYMNHLGYHRFGEPKIHINSRLSMKMQMLTAKEMIQNGLPIKCLHAVVLAAHFTNCIDTVERFPVYFRSHVGAKEYKHIVLGIYVQGHFGALGISRDGGLQDKPTSYAKLSDLIFEFAKCYGQSGHILNEVKLGNIITHDQHSLERLFTKNYVIPICGCMHSDIEKNVEKFAKQLRAKMGLACLKSLRVDSATSSRFSRSRSSLNGNASACGGSAGGSCSTLRARALSMGPLRGNNNNRINDVHYNTNKKPSKLVMTRSKPTLMSKRKQQ